MYQYINIAYSHWIRGFTALNDRHPHIHHVYLANQRQTLWTLFYPKLLSKLSKQQFAVLIDSDSKNMQQCLSGISFLECITLSGMIVSIPHAVVDGLIVYYFASISLYILGISGISISFV